MFEGQVLIKKYLNGVLDKEYVFNNTVVRRAKNASFGKGYYAYDPQFLVYEQPISDEDLRDAYYNGVVPPNGINIGRYSREVHDDIDGRSIIATTGSITGPQIINGIAVLWGSTYSRLIAVLRLSQAVEFTETDSYVIQYKLTMRW